KVFHIFSLIINHLSLTISKIKTETVAITLFDNGIAEFEALPQMTGEFSVDHVKEVLSIVKTFNHKNRLFLIHIKNGKYDKAARNYLAQQNDIADKIAMVATKPLQTMLGNFFLGVNRPKLNIKLFNSYLEA